jgi:hypothetical protein
MACQLLPTFMAGAWAAVAMMLVCLGAAYLCGKPLGRPTAHKDDVGSRQRDSTDPSKS